MTSFERFEKVTHGPWKTAGLDVQYRVEAENGIVRVFFQCTKSWIDWIVDLFVFPVVHAFSVNMKVHIGYEAAFLSVVGSVMREVRYYIGFAEKPHIEIHGYSYGGGLATLLHFYYRRFFPLYQVHTELYGSPRVVFGKLTADEEALFDGLVSVKVYGDIVTHYMPKLSRYRDVGEVRYIGNRANRWKLSWFLHKPDEYRKGLRG